MRNKFVKTANVQAFLAGMAQLEERGAPEASMMLVSGDAGHGKSRTASWWAVQSDDAIFVRLKAACTPHWLLADVVRELKENDPARTCEKLFAQVVGALVSNPRPIVVDEVESGLHDIKVIETLRDISDITEVPVILVGREFVAGHLKRHRQIDTRISARVNFAPVSLDDVTLLARELCEVDLAEDLCREILRDSDGRIRNAVKAMANAERVAKRKGKKTLGLADIDRPALLRGMVAAEKPAAQPLSHREAAPRAAVA